MTNNSKKKIILSLSFSISTALFSANSLAQNRSSNSLPVSSTSVISPLNPIQGFNAKQVHERFASIIEFNLSKKNSDEILGRLSDKELADLAFAYKNANNGSATSLLNMLAGKSSVATLHRLSAVFGTENVSAAVSARAPSGVAAAYMRDPQSFAAANVLKPSTNIISAAAKSQNVLAAAGTAPTVDMTPYEVYLEFRTAEVGSLSVQGALAETGIFVASRIVPAAAVGTIIGTGINDVIETYDPDLENAIGGTIDSGLTNISDATANLAQGNYEQALDNLFGGMIQSSGNLSGDYGVSSPMYDYLDND